MEITFSTYKCESLPNLYLNMTEKFTKKSENRYHSIGTELPIEIFSFKINSEKQTGLSVFSFKFTGFLKFVQFSFQSENKSQKL